MTEEAPKNNSNIKQRAFVAMPHGLRNGRDGSVYNFDAIYFGLIKPALESVNFVSSRIDENVTKADLATDLFQEFLLAGLVVFDLSIDDANTFYQLGVCHALRKKCIVHIQSEHAHVPFDIFNIRVFPYHITAAGNPDPDFLDNDKHAMSRILLDAWNSLPSAIQSPIFSLLPGLEEPKQKHLWTPLAIGYWREYDEWKNDVIIACRQKHFLDIVSRTKMITNPLVKEEAIIEAGKMMACLESHDLALELYRIGLGINTNNLVFRRQEAFHLFKIGYVEEAIVVLERILIDYPNDSDTLTLLGDLYKDIWMESWKGISDHDKRSRAAYEAYHWLSKAFHAYRKSLQTGRLQFYSAITSLILGTILVNLENRLGMPDDHDPDIMFIQNDLILLMPALEFAVINADLAEPDYWMLVSKACLLVLNDGESKDIYHAYRNALTVSRYDSSILKKSLQLLEILCALDIRSEYAQIGYKVIKQEISRIHGNLE